MAQAVKSYIKDANDFLNKVYSLPKLPANIVLCTVDVVGDALSAFSKPLGNRMKKYISSDTLCDLPEVSLKNDTFTSGKKPLM